MKKSKLSKAIQHCLSATTVFLMAPNLALAQSPETVEEVFVTGSRLKQANLESSSPITQLDAEEISFQGIVRLEDLLRNQPQIYSSQNSGQSNGATGTATVNLRNLGEERTLVLVNGKRMPVGSPIQGGFGADINQIPARLVERVEVLTGGASAIYGSDAVAGVVNFFLKDDFEGIELDYQNSVYRHENDNSRYRSILRESGEKLPDGTVTDGGAETFSVIAGANFEEGKGNVTAYATYRRIDPSLQADRDFSACALNGNADDCVGSGTIPQGRITDFDTFDFIVDGTDFVDRQGETFNFGALNYYQRPDERFTAGAFYNFEINDHAEIYGETMFMDDQSVAQIAPSGAFFVTNTIPCGNPLLSDQQFESLCGQFGLTEDDIQDAFVGRRNVEGGNRQDDLRHTSFRNVIGIEGAINDAWFYDVSYLFAEVSLERTYNNDLSITRLRRALDATSDEDGNTVCQSVVDGSDPNCVPYNVFETGGVTQDQLDYLDLPLFVRGTTELDVFNASISGDLGEYGIKFPTAEAGIQVAFGYERRNEILSYNPDQGFRAGDGAGQGGSSPAVSGGFEVKDYFVETILPILSGLPGAESLDMSLSYRESDYDFGVDTDSFGIGTSWKISESVALRASYNEAVRAPNVRELFQPQGLNLFDRDVDPCSGPVEDGVTGSGRTFEQCARSGVTEEQFGRVPNNPAGQFNFLQGGNTELEAEEATTQTMGVVFTPSFVDGLSVTLDYYNIEIEKGIDNLSPNFILNQCEEENDEALCALVNRSAGQGDLWIGSDINTSGYITALNSNFAVEEVTGYDLIVSYDLELGDLGSMRFNNTTAYIDSFNVQQTPLAPATDCAAKWGLECEEPTADLRNNFRTTWETPLDLTVSLLWRHIGAIDDLTVPTEDTTPIHLASVNYFDLSLIWAPIEMVTVRAGINNILDEEPPVAGGRAGPGIEGNGNTFPGFYDALGQNLFAGITLKF